MKKYGNSSYWLSDWDDDDIITSTMNKAEKKSNDIYKLASTKRAISNFVNIVTNKQIPVNFNQRGDSYTDGKTIVIGSNIVKPSDFDISVGLALHEGSHIKLSDFELLTDIDNLVPNNIKNLAHEKGVSNTLVTVKNIWNVVEDRRIDRYVFDSAPGYRDYYRAMYDKYFNDKLIDKALQSDEHTDVTVDSYMFRIVNIHNKNTRLDALPGLREIYSEIGLGSIGRLKSSLDTFNVALKVFQIILNNLPSIDGDGDGDGDSDSDNTDEQPNGDSGGDGAGDGNDQSDTPRDMTDEEFESLTDSLDSSGGAGGGDDGGDDAGGGNGVNIKNSPDLNGKPMKPSNDNGGSDVKLTDRQKELLKKKIEKQKKFMDGDVSKRTLTKKDISEIEAVEESGSEMVTVAKNLQTGWGRTNGIQCVVVKKLTRSLLESSICPLTRTRYYSDEPIHASYTDEVTNGIKLGTLLGKKLQIRGEDRNTVYNRQKHGRIDKRMISSLGFGNENVFQYMETDSYKKANLHISVDASGSMGGSKWRKTLTNVVALCKAVDMIQNLSIQVSIRTTTENGTSVPYVALAYDSTIDKFSKVKQMFPYIGPYGTTPEGLCFEAIMDNFLPSNNDMDSYFLNISDGEPYFSADGLYYCNDTGFNHTRKMVKKIEALGVKTLSYYVTDYMYGNGEPSEGFKTMYGKSAKMVDITNISQISKTMNQLFLEK